MTKSPNNPELNVGEMPAEIFVKEFSSGDETILEAMYIEANKYQRYVRADLVEKMKEHL